MIDETSLPEGWLRVPLGQLGSFTNGINKNAMDFGFGVPFVNLLDVFGRTRIADLPGGLVNATLGEIDRYSLREGDVLFIRSSVKPSGVGLTALVERTLETTVYSGFLIRFRPEPNRFARDFLRYCFQSKDFRRSLISKSTVSANTNINQVSLRQIETKLPPIYEQRCIAEILSTLDETIEQTEALIAKYQQIKAGLMHDLFTRGVTPDGKLRPTRAEAPQLYKESPIGWIPKEWKVVPTEHFAVKVPGATTIGPFGSDLLSTDYCDEGVPVIFVRDVKEDAFEWNSNVYVSRKKAQRLAAHMVKSGDILSTKMGLPPCISCQYPSWMEQGVITADIIRLRPEESRVDIRWLSAALNSAAFKRQVQ
ncbi:MAG: restriction endonuclease subunit S, partial [Candidatus Binatia bacterium]